MPSDQYRDFAPIYRALADDRGVFADESDVVQSVIQHAGLKRDARILDVACGTGDVIKRLLDAGYEGVSGLDGSAAMIAQAANLGLPPSVTLTVCRWEELNQKCASTREVYDLVFMLANSLANAQRDLIPEILAWVFQALKPGGILCLDQREWTRDPTGRLIQANRTENTLERKPGHDVAMGDTSLRVHEICEYDDGLQRITYRVQQMGFAMERPERVQWFELYYTPFQVHETVNWLADTGYTNVRAKAPPSPPAPHGWPYWMVTAERPACR